MSGVLRLSIEAAAVAAWALASVRWLRVAQREHYLAGSATRFARRWWLLRPPNPILAAVGLAAGLAGLAWAPAALVVAAIVAIGPVGLGVRGRTAPLRWTWRLKRLATLTAAAEAVALVVGHLVGAQPAVALVAAGAAPLLVDLALAVACPLEHRLSSSFVRQAETRLRAVGPRVVAITGSFGKTSTKEHLRELLAGSMQVVASPASFNNRLGLARAVNDQLAAGTDVFVAEMGTYGKGEIAALCSWLHPSVSVLTAVGPVHLERFRTLEAVATAKAEIFAGAQTAVVNADDPHVVAVTPDESSGIRVVRCSEADRGADVYAGADGVWVAGERIGDLPEGVFAANVACAVGAGVALGVAPAAIGARLHRLRPAAHRQEVATSANGAVVIDDTYNANPSGAAAGLERLSTLAGDGDGRRVVVTPGMIELGPRQHEENAAFAARAAEVATDLLVVGATNRRALRSGAAGGRATVTLVANREAATEWVRRNVGPGDVVLYENDLPDHHP